ncbi:MAG TPA: monovalent cation/H+ antiporter complex subunit F [Terriglobales bacterium]|nr:monovalent cation/H+ antiporter complex subunit F [Terriglobales bacterium]
MNPWMIASIGFLMCMIPCGIAAFRGSPMERLLGLEMGGIVVTMFLLVMAEGLGRPNFYDIGLTMALLAFGGGVVFTRFLERWL